MGHDSRTKNYHPVAVHFGRPDMASYIADTVRDTPPPTPEWSEVDLTEDHTLSKSGKVVQVRRRRIGARETGTEPLEGSNQHEGMPVTPRGSSALPIRQPRRHLMSCLIHDCSQTRFGLDTTRY